MNNRSAAAASPRTSDMKFIGIISAHTEGRRLNPDDIRQAIEEAKAAIPAARAEADKIEKHRKAVLLTAGDDEMEQAERQVAERRRTAERLEAAVVRLGEILTAVEEGEALGKVQSQAAEFQQKLAALEVAWKKTYPAALASVRKLLALEEEAERAFRLWEMGQRRLLEKLPQQSDAVPTMPSFPGEAFGYSPLSRMVQMPDTTGRLCTPEAILPRHDSLLRISGLERMESAEQHRQQRAQSEAAYQEMMRKKDEGWDQPRPNEVRRPRNGAYPPDGQG